MTILQQRLIDLRTDKGLSQKDLAKKINVSGSAIGYWETGTNEPKATYLSRLSEFFEVSTDYLLGLEDDFGSRTVAPMGDTTTADERDLLEVYRTLSPELRETLWGLLATWTPSKTLKSKKKV